MTLKKKYFGTDGIRGKANTKNMNAALALNIGMATAEFFTRGTHKHSVLIGKDTRLLFFGPNFFSTPRNDPTLLSMILVKIVFKFLTPSSKGNTNWYCTKPDFPYSLFQ